MARTQIRLLKGPNEFQECERIQEAVWGAVGVASEVMIVTQKYGGAVLGAFVGRKCVGFIYAFLARRGGRLIHWSHQMAVREPFRNLGVGFNLKMAHRRYATQQGLTSICWTYDPLQSRNASLNIARLGAQAEEYLPDCYGHFPSLIEKDLPSDRFVVNWKIASAAVARWLRNDRPTLSATGLPVVNPTRWAREFLENRKSLLNLQQRRLLVEIPTNTDRMRAESLDLARRWRLEIRRIFLHYLAMGYRVVGFVRPGPASSGRCYYVLSRGRETAV
jgi:predicted GNAT superfamily acetyltransferase